MAATSYKLYFQCHYGKLKSHLVQMVKQSMFEVCVLKFSSFKGRGLLFVTDSQYLWSPRTRSWGSAWRNPGAPWALWLAAQWFCEVYRSLRSVRSFFVACPSCVSWLCPCFFLRRYYSFLVSVCTPRWTCPLPFCPVLSLLFAEKTLVRWQHWRRALEWWVGLAVP